jgi:glutamine amidotransferase
VGWHQIRSANQDTWDNGILANSVESEWMYFVHSYHAKPDSDDNVLSYIDYDMGKITAAVRQGNCYGLQFHPEKSGSKGLSIIEEFLKL